MLKKALAKMLLVGVGMAIVLFAWEISAFGQSTSQPKTIHSYCVGNCVVDVYFLHSTMGDSAAKNTYHNWFNTYYELTSCNPDWESEFSFLLDVIGDIVGAPGAPTLQCWQGVLGQARTCNNDCSGYFIGDAKFAPNLKLSLSAASQGHFEVLVDNHSNMNGLPELTPNAYSRKFKLVSYLKLNDGTPLLISQQEMPSLSFPNWIERSGYDDCVQAYGAEEERCQILASFLLPDETAAAVDFLNGALYDLTDQVNSQSDAKGSFSQDGYIRLLSNGDSITINQGDYSGFAWIKTHNKSKGTHTQELIPWDAHNGSVTITNHECNTYFSTCWISGDRTDSDTYVFALQGPAEKLLPGTYQVDVEAQIDHDKNISDNKASYTYEASSSPTDQDQDGSSGGTQGTVIHVGDLPLNELAGAGNFDFAIENGMPGMLFHLIAPAQLQNLNLRVIARTNHHFDTFIRYNTIPVPDYPTVNDDYDCWLQSDASYADVCPYQNPSPGDYYIFVSGDPGSAFRIEVQWIFKPVTSTPQPSPTPAVSITPLPSAQPTPLATAITEQYTEVEENDRRASANVWDMKNPFRGQLSATDIDYILISFSQPAIYTFTFTPLTPDLRLRVHLLRYSNGNIIQNIQAAAKEADVTMTFRALAGEQYYFSINASGLSSTLPLQAYQISLTNVIPDPDEPNDSRIKAVKWDMQTPYRGYIIPWSDLDYLLVKFNQSGIYTFRLEDLGNNQKPSVALLSPTSGIMLDQVAAAKGEAVDLTFDASAGEEFVLRIASRDSTLGSPNPYQISLLEMIDDSAEPNDDQAHATYWELSPLQGYFWDGVHGKADYIKFTAPATKDQSEITFNVSNPSSDLRIQLSLLNDRGYTLESVVGGKGESVSISRILSANKIYYLRLSTVGDKTSKSPYVLSATYVADDSQAGSGSQGENKVRLFGRVFLRNGLFPLPLSGVEIYCQIDQKPEQLLGKTNFLGFFVSNVTLSEGQVVRVWATKWNYAFRPQEIQWQVPSSARSHRFVFYGTESVVILATPSITDTPIITSMPTTRPDITVPPPGRTSVTPPPPARTSVTLPPATSTLISTSTVSSSGAQVRGYLWRLFPQSGSAGVANGQVLLTINGTPHAIATSMIDGSYSISIANLQAGDQLKLSASAAEDQFEPIYFPWTVEAGVRQWNYDFYSYWGTITPPPRDDQNRIYGHVTDAEGRGIPNIYILVQMGNSDALQRIGPTNVEGYYEGFVRLPNRVMVTVWVEQTGFIPGRQLFFHAYESENRQVDFTQTSAPQK